MFGFTRETGSLTSQMQFAKCAVCRQAVQLMLGTGNKVWLWSRLPVPQHLPLQVLIHFSYSESDHVESHCIVFGVWIVSYRTGSYCICIFNVSDCRQCIEIHFISASYQWCPTLLYTVVLSLLQVSRYNDVLILTSKDIWKYAKCWGNKRLGISQLQFHHNIIKWHNSKPAKKDGKPREIWTLWLFNLLIQGMSWFIYSIALFVTFCFINKLSTLTIGIIVILGHKLKMH